MTARSLLPLTAALLVALPVAAQRMPLNDSPSPRQQYSMELEWQTQEVMRAIGAMLNGQNDPLPPLTGQLAGVDVRLDTRQYVGRNVRIYLRLPTAMPGSTNVSDITLSWEAGGEFLAGAVSPGQDALLFEGTITETVTGDVLDFLISINIGETLERFDLEPFYEIEVTS